jgi:hypothetical protein
MRASTQVGAVEEYFLSYEAYGVSQCGGQGSKNVGISSRKADEKSAHRKSKVSWAMKITPGLGVPNFNAERH